MLERLCSQTAPSGFETPAARVARELIQENRARVLYDVKEIDPAKFIT